MNAPVELDFGTRPAEVAVGHRQCPTLPGYGRSLITHRIAAARCLDRQHENYHKCHRCVYRSQAEDWVYEAPPQLAETARNDQPRELIALPAGRNGVGGSGLVAD